MLISPLRIETSIGLVNIIACLPDASPKKAVQTEAAASMDAVYIKTSHL